MCKLTFWKHFITLRLRIIVIFISIQRTHWLKLPDSTCSLSIQFIVQCLSVGNTPAGHSQPITKPSLQCTATHAVVLFRRNIRSPNKKNTRPKILQLVLSRSCIQMFRNDVVWPWQWIEASPTVYTRMGWWQIGKLVIYQRRLSWRPQPNDETDPPRRINDQLRCNCHLEIATSLRDLSSLTTNWPVMHIWLRKCQRFCCLLILRHTRVPHKML